MADALRNELLAVPGIAGAEVEDAGGVAGVRVQLAVGADADAVGVAVRRILIAHGMRPSTATDEESSVVAAPPDDEPPVAGPPPPPGAPGSVVSFPLVGEHVAQEPAPEPVATLESVAVEETRQGVSVLVRTSTGAVATRPLDPMGSDLDESVAAAVAEHFASPEAELLGVVESEIAAHTVVTVLIGRGEERLSGAAVQRGGRAFVTARAVWAALERG
ncbi:MAG: hypothetical protein QNJ75_10240 [Acidimicrobiia bacterium]|nr:hypothetical protein [Acidimicrobiia bacterium]